MGDEIRTPLKAIKQKCIECCAGQKSEVRLCETRGCALYAFRLGKNPYKKPLTDEQREILAERARKNFHREKLESFEQN